MVTTAPMGLTQCARDIMREEGPAGFFAGLTALWARDVPFYVIFFGAYHAYQVSALYLTQKKHKEELSPFHYVLGGLSRCQSSVRLPPFLSGCLSVCLFS